MVDHHLLVSSASSGNVSDADSVRPIMPRSASAMTTAAVIGFVWDTIGNTESIVTGGPPGSSVADGVCPHQLAVPRHERHRGRCEALGVLTIHQRGSVGEPARRDAELGRVVQLHRERHSTTAAVMTSWNRCPIPESGSLSGLILVITSKYTPTISCSKSTQYEMPPDTGVQHAAGRQQATAEVRERSRLGRP